jgi:hypothetical protein
MGCDIHAHLEVKINGAWEHLNIVGMSRNYRAFAKMANVRNNGEIEPISKPRGIPSNASVVTRYMRDSYGLDGHSESWLSLDEMRELAKWVTIDDPDKYAAHKWFRNQFGIYAFEGSDPYFDDYRLVFWFDN